jgi:hypothetical protein
MIKINLIEKDISETKDDIAEYNIRLCDEYKKLDCLNTACLSWLKINSKRNYQNLEELLRKLNLDTHLIAKPIENIDDDFELLIPNGNENNKLKYALIVSCRKKEEAIEELLKYHKTYEENFKCLNLTGCLFKRNNDSNQFINIDKDNLNNEIEKNNVNDQNIFNNESYQIINCLKKYDFKILDGKSSINTIIEELKNQYNKVPEKIICGKVNNFDVYGLIINDEIASPIGWFEKDSDYQIIDFRNINKI